MNPTNKSRAGAFRPASVTQVSETSFELRKRVSRHIASHPYDTAPGRTAREWAAALVPRLQASTRREQRPHPHMKNGRGKPLTVSVVVGRPTFRNVVNENGNLV